MARLTLTHEGPLIRQLVPGRSNRLLTDEEDERLHSVRSRKHESYLKRLLVRAGDYVAAGWRIVPLSLMVYGDDWPETIRYSLVVIDAAEPDYEYARSLSPEEW